MHMGRASLAKIGRSGLLVAAASVALAGCVSVQDQSLVPAGYSGSTTASAASAAPEEARPVARQGGASSMTAAYARLCGGSSPSVSASTCASLKAEMDRAAKAQVSSTYAELCAPAAPKLSSETCAALAAEARANATPRR